MQKNTSYEIRGCYSAIPLVDSVNKPWYRRRCFASFARDQEFCCRPLESSRLVRAIGRRCLRQRLPFGPKIQCAPQFDASDFNSIFASVR